MYKVEFNTKEEWLEARKSCLTGTTVGKYIGIQSPYKKQTQAQIESNPAVVFGNNCEESILTIFKNLPAITKSTLVSITTKPTLWHSDADRRIAGSYDGLAFEDGKNGFVECKSTSAGLYDLKNMVIPETTWLQILHYFSLDEGLDFCYLVVCDYPKWGDRSVSIDWVRISRSSVTDRIVNLQGWHQYILSTWG